MNITKITSLSFLGKIIDAHAHVGHHEGKHFQKLDLDVFMREPLPNNDTVEKMIISDLDILKRTKSEYDGNKELLKNFNNNDKYTLLASCSPKDGDIKQIEKLFEEHPYKFAGLKFHPPIQNLETTSPEYKPYMEFAERKNLPCLFHTEVITDSKGKLINKRSISDPEAIYNLAKAYKTPVVMAHLGAGWNEAHDKAINVLVESIKKGDADLRADISWVDIDTPAPKGSSFRPKDHIIKAIKTLKGIGDSSWKYGDQSYRLMFGTDAPLARFNISEDKGAIKKYAKFVDEIKHAIRQDADLKADAETIIDDLFYNNAKHLYCDRLKAEEIKNLKNTLLDFNEGEKRSFKLNLALAGIIIGAGIIDGIITNKSKSKQK